MRDSSKRLTADQVLRQDGALVVRHVCPAVDLELAGLAGGKVVRLKGRVTPDLVAALPHVVDEEALDDALVDEEDVGVEDVDDGGVVDFTAEAVEGLVGGVAPEGDVEDADAALEQRVGQAELSEGLDGLWLQTVCPVSAGAVMVSARTRTGGGQGVGITFPRAYGRLGRR